jgi:hypothetical protein
MFNSLLAILQFLICATIKEKKIINKVKRSSPDLAGGRMKLRERQDDRMGLRGKQKNYEEAGWE